MKYRIHDTQVDTFTWGFITCLFFTTNENDFPEFCYSGEFSIDKNDANRLTSDALFKIIDLCSKFQEDNADLLAQTHGDDLQNGMDLCYAISGHGVGYTDRAYDHGWSEEVAEQLKNKARELKGELYPYKVGCNCYNESQDENGYEWIKFSECQCGDDTKIGLY